MGSSSLRLVLLSVVLASNFFVSLAKLDEEGDDLDIDSETCPPVAAAGTETIFLDTECSDRSIIKTDTENDCFKDSDCQAYSKCCSINHCQKRCIDLRFGNYTPLVNTLPSKSSKQKLSSLLNQVERNRGKREIQKRCVACSTCLRRCETDRDCARGRRNRCYHNSCSTYCV